MWEDFREVSPDLSEGGPFREMGIIPRTPIPPRAVEKPGFIAQHSSDHVVHARPEAYLTVRDHRLSGVGSGFDEQIRQLSLREEDRPLSRFDQLFPIQLPGAGDMSRVQAASKAIVRPDDERARRGQESRDCQRVPGQPYAEAN